MNEHDLALLPPAVQAYIRQLQAHAAEASAQIDEAQQHIATLTERIALLEEQFRLAQLKRFAGARTLDDAFIALTGEDLVKDEELAAVGD